MDNITLPAVLSTAPAFVQTLLSSPEPSNVIVNPSEIKKIVICHTRDVDKKVLDLLAKFGTVLSYDHNIHNNIDPATVEFAYLFVDMRRKSDRLYYQKFLHNNLAYHMVLYKWKFESDMGLPFQSQFSKFPVAQANRRTYDMLLTTTPIEPPSVCFSFLVGCARLGQ
jgi:hypothetical protein